MRIIFKPPTIIDRRMKRHGQPAEESYPGEILKQRFPEEIGMSQSQFVHAIGVPPNRIHDIVCARRNITADTDLRAANNLPTNRKTGRYELREARRGLGATIEKIVPSTGARRRV